MNVFLEEQSGAVQCSAVQCSAVQPAGGRETEEIQIKLATTSNENKRQQDAKNNAELQTERTKTA